MKPSKASFWVGWVLSAVPILFMGVGGVFFYFFQRDVIRKGMVEVGYPERLVPVIVALEVGCALLYALPPTAVLGAILMTAYLGGAVASHVRVGQTNWPFPVVIGAIAWLGLFLRDPRLRALVPFRRRAR